MSTVNIHEAKTHLSRLLEAVAAGEEIIIAKLVPIEKPKRKPGALKGTFIIDDAFFEPLPDDVLDVMETGYEHDPLNAASRSSPPTLFSGTTASRWFGDRR